MSERTYSDYTSAEFATLSNAEQSRLLAAEATSARAYIEDVKAKTLTGELGKLQVLADLTQEDLDWHIVAIEYRATRFDAWAAQALSGNFLVGDDDDIYDDTDNDDVSAE